MSDLHIFHKLAKDAGNRLDHSLLALLFMVLRLA